MLLFPSGSSCPSKVSPTCSMGQSISAAPYPVPEKLPTCLLVMLGEMSQGSPSLSWLDSDHQRLSCRWIFQKSLRDALVCVEVAAETSHCFTTTFLCGILKRFWLKHQQRTNLWEEASRGPTSFAVSNIQLEKEEWERWGGYLLRLPLSGADSPSPSLGRDTDREPVLGCPAPETKPEYPALLALLNFYRVFLLPQRQTCLRPFRP